MLPINLTLRHALGGYRGRVISHAVRFANLGLRSAIRSACEMPAPYRCPRAHVEFVNRALSPYHATYDVPPMQPTNDDTEHKPLVFLSPSGGRNYSADTVAKQVEKAIIALMDVDPDVKPHDIAVIISKSNRNAVFKQLEYRLSHAFAQRGYPDAVKLFETKGDGYTQVGVGASGHSARQRTIAASAPNAPLGTRLRRHWFTRCLLLGYIRLSSDIQIYRVQFVV